MQWLDENRRVAFQRNLGVRAPKHAVGLDEAETTGDFERVLPREIVDRALAIGNELILPCDDAFSAIDIATDHEIAVLGFDPGEVLANGFQVMGFSDYDRNIRFTGDWAAYVATVNAEAKRWMEAHRLGRNCGYVLMCTSKKEFTRLRDSER